jgi:predicted transcriptional regulator
MADLTAKQLALRVVEQLPDDATLEDAMEHLFFLEKIERGRADARAGRVTPHEEVRARFGLGTAER